VTLYLLRHGIAEDVAPSGDDGDRRLTPQGQARMRAEAAGMQRLRLTFDAILTSPLARAAETAAIVAAAFPKAGDVRVIAELATGVPPPEMLRALGPYLRRHDAVLAVGHEPGLSRLAALLLTGSGDGLQMEVKKGGLIAIEAHATRRPTASLCWMLTPRQLRRLARR
jgi:phosphohistidine phosphatase